MEVTPEVESVARLVVPELHPLGKAHTEDNSVEVEEMGGHDGDVTPPKGLPYIDITLFITPFSFLVFSLLFFSILVVL